MRIWSVHPSYLDAKGLVALWRETLLAKHVLEGKTKGYTNHPQLDRFKKLKDPLNAINQYLGEVYEEAVVRGYHFDKSKIDWNFKKTSIKVTDGQMEYERKHLLTKLKKREPAKFKQISAIKVFKPHPLFKITKGPIENWEIV